MIIPKLRAPVADVIIGDHVVPQKARYTREAVANDRTANVTDVHLLRHVRRAEIDDDRFRFGHFWHAQAIVLRQVDEPLSDDRVLQPKIEKTRPGDLWFVTQIGDIQILNNLSRELPRIRAQDAWPEPSRRSPGNRQTSGPQ